MRDINNNNNQKGRKEKGKNNLNNLNLKHEDTHIYMEITESGSSTIRKKVTTPTKLIKR